MRLSARKATLELAETFVISRSQDTADVVYVEIEHDGVTGYGEGDPIDRYEESAESAVAYLESHGGQLGDDPWALDEIEARLPTGSSQPGRRSTLRCTTSRASLRAAPSGACSGCGAQARRPRSRSGSATRTTWPAGQRPPAAGSSG